MNREKPRLPMRPDLLICLLLTITTLWAYAPVRHHEFLAYDDDAYVTANPQVKAGMTLAGLKWAFSTGHARNWHPVTWLSHQLDVELYGINPGRHHLTSLLIHVINTLLLFIALRQMTGALWQSGFVAALFALHPLQVESVAWISERKNVLSALFFFLTMMAYTRYAEKPNFTRYLPVFFLFGLGLMAKPMLVTLPFVLLLLDYWPLKRTSSGPGFRLSNAARLIIEKIPLFALSTVSCIITYFVQKAGGAVKPLDMYPLDVRLANSLVSYAVYLKKMIWPHDLAHLYPHPGMPHPAHAAGAAVLLLLISVAAVRLFRDHPYMAVGWLWYLGMLVPVAGLVQVGPQAMADRYTYTPLIGVFIMIAWAIPEIVRKPPRSKVLPAAVCTVLLPVLAGLTHHQTRYWSDSVTLYEHTLAATENNAVTHLSLGSVLQDQGKLPQAMVHYREALRIEPDFMAAHNNLGSLLEAQGNLDAAIRHYTLALRLKPGAVKARSNLAIALEKQGRWAEAVEQYRKILRMNPENTDALFNLGAALLRTESVDEAVLCFKAVLQKKPDHLEAMNNLAVGLFQKGETDAAIAYLKKALQIDPDYEKAARNLQKALSFREQKGPSI